MKKYLWISVVISFSISFILISIFIFNSFKHEQERVFILKTQLSDNEISKKVQLLETVLKNYQTLFHARNNIDPDMFRIFSKDVLSEYPYMNQFHYSPQVLAKNKESFEKEKRLFGYYNFKIKPFKIDNEKTAEYEQFFPTLYIEPFTPRNSQSLGVDIFNNPLNKQSIKNSILTGKISMSVEKEKGLANFFIPVYNAKSIPANEKERQERINGIISLKVLFYDFISDLNMDDVHFRMSQPFEEKNNDVLIEKFEKNRFDLLKILELDKNHTVYLDTIRLDLHFSQSFQLYDLSYKTVSIGLFVLFLVVFGNYYLLKKHLALKDELEKSIKQEEMLIQQSKLASMGEMIGNIAHQWRQPLAQISAIHMNMKVTYDFDKFTKEYLKEKIKEANKLTAYMSQTISDFQDFFKPKGEKVDFSVNEACTSSFHILESAFSYHNIDVTFNVHEDAVINGYKNEYSQVFLNILSNAKDILREREIENPAIEISIKKDKNNYSLVTISDNAGGIPEEIIDRIFEPYFTTRHKTQGTGIGLYMSKNIIERNMNGFITVKNTHDGALFTIKVKSAS